MTSQQGGTNWKCYLKQGLFIAALWSPAGKGLTTWFSFVMLNSVFVTFLCGILGQVWYLIVSIPDLFPFITYYQAICIVQYHFMILLESIAVRQRSNCIQFIHISFKDPGFISSDHLISPIH